MRERRNCTVEWLIILIVVLAVMALGLCYLIGCVGRFGLVRKLSRGRKWPRRLISLAILIVIFILLALWLSPVNAVVVFLHGVLFFLLFGLVARLLRRVTGRETRVYWQGWLALGVTVLWLGAGYLLCSHVWQTDYSLRTDKKLGTLKIALIADSHLGTTFDGAGFAEHLRVIEEQEPDLLVIAGDFVDDSTGRADLDRACRALGELELPCGVWFVYGNHDAGYYNSRDFSAADLEDALQKNGVHVLRDEAELVDGRFYLVGREDRSRAGRKTMAELLDGLDRDKYLIVLDHQPNDYAAEAAAGADLVLSGHSHGGQLIPITYVGEWFGMLDRTYGYERREGTDFIVTSGISCWEILFKTGTRSEYVLITVEGNP